MLRGLEAAHAAGFLHRDIKPSNILLAIYAGGHSSPCSTAGGLSFQVWLADFSRARETMCSAGEGHAGDAKMTARIGTYVYSAPEMLWGRASYNESVDIWSTGAVLFDLPALERLVPEGFERGINVLRALSHRLLEPPAELSDLLVKARTENGPTRHHQRRCLSIQRA